MIVKEYVAFQTVDKEWGTWCNKAFFFETIEEAEVFFSDVNNIMNALGLELKEDDDYIMETIEEVQSSLKIYREWWWKPDVFTGCEFTCNHVGTTIIKEMSIGFVVSEVTV
jgi:hypothetical protein